MPFATILLLTFFVNGKPAAHPMRLVADHGRATKLEFNHPGGKPVVCRWKLDASGRAIHMRCTAPGANGKPVEIISDRASCRTQDPHILVMRHESTVGLLKWECIPSGTEV